MTDPLTDDSGGKSAGESIGVQRTYLVTKNRFQYEGLFIIQDLYKVIDEYFEEKGYDKREIKNAEIVRDDGVRFLELIFEPWKKLTDYAKSVIKVQVMMENIREVEIKRNGLKIRAHQGKVLCVIDAYIETDYEGIWERNTTRAVIRVLYDRFFLKHYTKQYNAEVIDDYKMLVYHIKTLLNMQQE